MRSECCQICIQKVSSMQSTDLSRLNISLQFVSTAEECILAQGRTFPSTIDLKCPFREIKFWAHATISLHSLGTNACFYASGKRGSADGVTCCRHGSLRAQNEKESTPDRGVGYHPGFCKVYAGQEVRVHLGECFPSGSFSKETMTCETAERGTGVGKT